MYTGVVREKINITFGVNMCVTIAKQLFKLNYFHRVIHADEKAMDDPRRVPIVNFTKSPSGNDDVMSHVNHGGNNFVKISVIGCK